MIDFGELLFKILTWVEGNTSIRYVVTSPVEFANTTDPVVQFSVKTDWVDVDQEHQAIAMMANKMRLVISGVAVREDTEWGVQELFNKAHVGCAFQFQTPQGGEQSVSRSFTFKDKELFHVR